MTHDKSTIEEYLGKGNPCAVEADEYLLDDLVKIATTAAGCQTELTISVTAQTNKGIIDQCSKFGGKFVRLDFRKR